MKRSKFLQKRIDNYFSRKNNLFQNGIKKYFFNQKGYVLIFVLLMTTLLISISSKFIIVTQTNAGYIKKIKQKLNASMLAKSGIHIAKTILKIDSSGIAGSLLQGINNNKAIDTCNDLWAINFPPIPMGTITNEDAILKIKIEDENAKINLSVLATKNVDKTPFYAMTQRFFQNFGISMDLADTIIDWVDIDDSRFPYGAETSDYYTTLFVPYKAKNSEMYSIDELLLIKGVTPEIFYGLRNNDIEKDKSTVGNNYGNKHLTNKFLETFFGKSTDEKKNNLDQIKIGKEKSKLLSNYFRVYGDNLNHLSSENKININTASYRVLSALTENMTDDKVTELIKRRMEKPFTSVSEIEDLVEEEYIRKLLSVKSFIFKFTIKVKYKKTNYQIIAYYNRQLRRFIYWSEE